MIDYIKKNGVKRCIEVIYKYKIDIVFIKIIRLLLKSKDLKNIIVIESHNDFDCNGGAFYNYLIDNNFNKEYKIIWLLKNNKPNDAPKNVEYFYLNKPNLKKAYYICRAKYLLFDNTIINKAYLNQKSFYLTHGAISLKNVKGLCNIPNSIDYILSPSNNYDEILSNQLSLEYPNNKMIHLGYPSEDIYFKSINDEIEKITNKKYKKKILWMPTFRKGAENGRVDSEIDLFFGIPLINDMEMFEKLDKILRDLEILLIIKIHPMQDLKTIINLKETDNIKIITGITIKELKIDNYRLMANVDALISDYSSVAYSYLLLNRPIGFILSDLKYYKLGLCVDNFEDYLVGPKILEFEDMIKFIESIANNNDEFKVKRTQLREDLYKYKDGESCKRLAEFMGLKHESKIINK